MELSVDTLKDAGGFVGAPVKTDVTWHVDGEARTATVYVRLESFQTITGRWEGQDAGADATAARIAASICKKDGSPALSVADIMGEPATGHGPLSAELTIALLAAIHRVNGQAGAEDGKPKKSRRTKSSGTTSS